jgi:hypothetical protein
MPIVINIDYIIKYIKRQVLKGLDYTNVMMMIVKGDG